MLRGGSWALCVLLHVGQASYAYPRGHGCSHGQGAFFSSSLLCLLVVLVVAPRMPWRQTANVGSASVKLGLRAALR